MVSKLALKTMGIFSALNRNQKEAVGLLQIGTFLEYFDLMLYVHMAVLLNELFFPKAEPHMEALLAAFAFCSTYLLRPVGALVFGYIGDTMGRKTVVIITTLMMAFSCVVMANLPTYAQIGIAASWIVTICRILQGMSSMGELVGAGIYLTEITQPPVRYPIVAFTSVCSILGGTFALGVAKLVTSYAFDWRMAFWIGAFIALIGFFARTVLKETATFADAKKRLRQTFADTNQDERVLKKHSSWNEKLSNKTFLHLFLMDCAWPICFYFAYVHCGHILKHSFGFTAAQVIHQNFMLSIIQLIGTWIIAYLSYKVYPISLLKIKLVLFLGILLLAPYLLTTAQSPLQVLFLQASTMLFACDMVPAVPITYARLPVFKRFTASSLSYALSRIVMYLVTSFGLVYLTEYFGHVGFLILALPVTIGYALGVLHFEKLEKVAGVYPQKKTSWGLLSAQPGCNTHSTSR